MFPISSRIRGTEDSAHWRFGTGMISGFAGGFAALFEPALRGVRQLLSR